MALKFPSLRNFFKKITLPAKRETHEIVKGHMTTKIKIKYDVGFGNTLTIRGQGAGLSWEKGIPLKNVHRDEWIFETEKTFTEIEFKILINDKIYENGENHLLKHGSHIQYGPIF